MKKTTCLALGAFWFGGGIAVFFLVDPEIPAYMRLVAALTWVVSLPLYAYYRKT